MTTDQGKDEEQLKADGQPKASETLESVLPGACEVVIYTDGLSESGLMRVMELVKEPLARGAAVRIWANVHEELTPSGSLWASAEATIKHDGLRVRLYDGMPSVGTDIWVRHPDGSVVHIDAYSGWLAKLGYGHEYGARIDEYHPGETGVPAWVLDKDALPVDVTTVLPVTADTIEDILRHPGRATRERAVVAGRLQTVTTRRTHVLGNILEETVDEIEQASGSAGELTGLTTGFTDFDALTNGLRPGHLTVIASRPSVGKSTLLLDFVRSAAVKHKAATLLVSPRRKKVEVTLRLLSAHAGIQLQHMRKGTMRDEDWTRLAAAMGEVSDAPLFINDTPGITAHTIAREARRLADRNNLRLIAIDGLQDLLPSKVGENRYHEVTEVVHALKFLARDLDLPIVLTSTLNREPEWRASRCPQLSDLRNSGDIEDVADEVILIHRESLYDRESPREGEADLIVAKHTEGPSDMIVLAFQGHYSRFTNMASSF